MCGRYTLISLAEALAALFELTENADWGDPRYNIAPQTQIVTVRRRSGERIAQSLLWGAINPRDARPLINARSETVATSPLFARAFSQSRILVPADGFFEWTDSHGARRARYFTPPSGGPCAFAGLAISTPERTDGGREEAAVILTTAASASVREYHNRMPLMIARPDYEQWLREDTNPESVIDLMSSGGSTAWASHHVGSAVNNVRNDRPECIAPAEPAPQAQGRLF